ncbi:hypothetical protein ACIPIC_36495 [Streptomyces collinus]|uniref:hypothetical protein n=1 Tax=Streptomyces collinus TaxID=42684 RepID=UPI0017832E84|nr:hypothetical protein GCM10010309_71930 [Streptomyces violaceochromogenes]
MTELATQLGFSRSRVSRAVARQEFRGVLARSACPRDARAAHAAVTDQGTVLLGRLSGIYEVTVRDSLTRFHVRAEQLEVLVQHLQPLVDHVDRPLALSACTRRQRPATLDALPHSTGHR